jgi:3-oxoacyl-[acyl-carrier-protein] synthase III
MIKTRFESIGFFLPEKIVTTQQLIQQMKNKPMFDFEQITGIRERRVCSEQDNSFSMAMKAAQSCLKKSSYNAEDLDIIIFTSITHFKENQKYYVEPSISLFLKKELGAHKAINFDISNACAGMCTGVYILNSMIKSGAVKNGMVVSGECITPIADTAVKEIKDQIDDQFASLTVGDSSVSVIVDQVENIDNIKGKIEFIDFLTVANFADMCLGMPSNENPGIAMYAKSSDMHRNFSKRWPIFLEEVMKRQGKTFNASEYDYIIFHQTSEKAIHQYIQSGETYFQQEMPESLYSIQEYGNTSTTTHFVALYDGLKNQKIKQGAKLLFIVLASGMIFGVLSTTIGSLEI